MSCETMSFRRYGERRQNGSVACVDLRWASQPPIYPSNYQLLLSFWLTMPASYGPPRTRSTAGPAAIQSLSSELSLYPSLPPNHLRLRDAAGTRSPPPHPPFSLKECAPTLHFPVTSGGQPPRLRDGGLPCCCSPPASCSVLPVSRPPSDW
jgi:hypothetical protein